LREFWARAARQDAKKDRSTIRKTEGLTLMVRADEGWAVCRPASEAAAFQDLAREAFSVAVAAAPCT
jgi:hypothetical protein